jgi:hypothetical protein
MMSIIAGIADPITAMNSKNHSRNHAGRTVGPNKKNPKQLEASV